MLFTQLSILLIINDFYCDQGREWLTSWVALTDSYPVIIQFDVLPLVDIGGTLDINVNLEMDKVLEYYCAH